MGRGSSAPGLRLEPPGNKNKNCQVLVSKCSHSVSIIQGKMQAPRECALVGPRWYRGQDCGGCGGM